MSDPPTVDMTQKEKGRHRSLQQGSKSDLEGQPKVDHLFSTENPLPDNVGFFRQRTFWGKGWEFLALPLALVSLVLIASLFKTVPWQALALVTAVECIMLIPLWLLWRRKQLFADKNERWGIFLTPEQLIYRTPVQHVRISTRLIDKLHTPNDSEPKLTVIYREAAHLNPKKLYIDQYFDLPLRDLIQAIEIWKANAEQLKVVGEAAITQAMEDIAETQAWEKKFKEIYAYRKWLPGNLVDSIPSLPCSVEERMVFLDRLKPYEKRMRWVDSIGKWSRIVWSISIVGQVLWMYFSIYFGDLKETMAHATVEPLFWWNSILTLLVLGVFSYVYLQIINDRAAVKSITKIVGTSIMYVIISMVLTQLIPLAVIIIGSVILT